MSVPAISILLALSGNAHAQQVIRESDFFDFEFAKTVWANYSDPQVDEYLSKVCVKGTPYDAWNQMLRKNQHQALADLENNPDAKIIQQCSDVLLTFDLWGDMYVQWRHGIGLGGSDGWNDCGSGLRSMRVNPAVLKDMNVFTGRCDDMPDWRTPKNRGEDEANIEKGNMRRDATRALRGK